MANRQTIGFGFTAAGTLGQTPATSGQGKYKIDAGYGLLYTIAEWLNLLLVTLWTVKRLLHL